MKHCMLWPLAPYSTSFPISLLCPSHTPTTLTVYSSEDTPRKFVPSEFFTYCSLCLEYSSLSYFHDSNMTFSERLSLTTVSTSVFPFLNPTIISHTWFLKIFCFLHFNTCYMLCSLLYSSDLEQYLAHSKHPINTCWISEKINEYISDFKYAYICIYVLF